MQCSSQVFECRAFPTAAAKSQCPKLTLLRLSHACFKHFSSFCLAQHRNLFRVSGSPILVAIGAPASFPVAPQQTPREVALRERQPTISGVLDQASACFHLPLLQPRNTPSYSFRCCRLISGNKRPLRPPALGTLPRRSFAAKQLPS